MPEPISTSTAALRTHSFRAMASEVTVQIVGVEADEAAAAADRAEGGAAGAEFVRATHALDCAGSRLVLPRV